MKTIAEIKKERGLTNDRLAEITEIPRWTVVHWSCGAATPPEWAIRLIEYYLDHEGYEKLKENRK